MHQHTSQRGAALILLLGITAALAILSTTLVFVLVNQGRATANERSRTQSLYAAEAALDSGVQMAKVASPMPTASPATPWLSEADLGAAFNNQFPTGAVVDYRVYDNQAAIDKSITWDKGSPTAATTPDQMMWVEATVTYHKKTTRARVLIRQSIEPFAKALPKAVTYSDTGINLKDQSDIYRVKADGTPDTSGTPYPTSISAGGTWTSSMSSSWAEVGRFTSNGSADLAAPGTSVQSFGIRANGSVVTTGHSFNDVTVAPGTVGFFSDYFDQKAQADLANESQAGGNPAAAPPAPTAPLAPSSWGSSGTNITTTVLTTLQTNNTTPYTATTDLVLPTTVNSGNLTLTRGTNTTTKTFTFKNLYVAGNLTLTGPVVVNATSLYVGGTLTINNATITTVTDNVGPLYVNGTGACNVTGRVNLNTNPLTTVSTSPTSAYVRGSFTLSNSTSNPVVTDSLGNLYVVGALGVTDFVNLATTSAYTAGGLTINNSGGTTLTDSLGQLYAAGTSASNVTGRVNLTTTTSVYTGGALTISNSTSNPVVTDTLVALYVVGDLSVSGNVTLSATSYLYAGGNATITGPTTSTLITDQFGLVYTSGTSKTLTFANNVQIKATAVVAYGDFTISGANIAFTDWLGPIYVAAFSSSSNPSLNHGDVTWRGTASVTSRNYLNPTANPLPMWLGRLWTRTGTYNDEYGNIWVPGNSSTSISLGSTGNSTILCPLLCTTERTEVSGHITFGRRAAGVTPAAPMVYFFMCDNNGIYPQVVDWSSTGTFFGLMVINESTIDFKNGVSGTPSVEGAVFAGSPYDPTHTSGMSMSDIVLEDQSSIAYNQAIVGAVSTSSLHTTTLVTQTVPGSWQQLPVH
jgi:Tfp pilus assembly protein PilX